MPKWPLTQVIGDLADLYHVGQLQFSGSSRVTIILGHHFWLKSEYFAILKMSSLGYKEVSKSLVLELPEWTFWPKNVGFRLFWLKSWVLLNR